MNNQRIMTIALVIIAVLLAVIVVSDFADKRAEDQRRQEQEAVQWWNEFDQEMEQHKEDLWNSAR